MKKITLLVAFIFAFSWQSQAQLFMTENFDSGIPSNWSGDYSTTGDFACEGQSIKDNLWSSSTDGELVTSNYVGISNGTDLTVSIEYKVVDYNSNNPTAAGWGTAELQYSTDDGAAWNTFYTIDDSNHVVSEDCAIVSATVPAANIPSGSDIKLRVFVARTDGDYNFYIDNFETTQEIDCTFPEVTTEIVEDCGNGNYTIEVDVADLGDATSLTLTNDAGAPDMPITEAGVIEFGPIPAGTVVNLNLAHDGDSDCNIDLGTFKDACPAPNDTISGASSITPSAPGTGCDAFTFTYDYGDGTVTDSGLDSSCDNENTGLDLFFSWTATSAALVWNDGAGNPGITIRQADGTEIVCESSYASDDTVLSGWDIGDNLIIQIYDTYTSATEISFCLEELLCPAPTNVMLDLATVTATSAGFNWDVSASEELGYDWIVMAAGEDPEVDTPVVSGSTNPGETSVVVSGLTGSASYDFYILSNCDANGLSSFAGPVNFETDCDIIIPDYEQDFTDFTPFCWENAQGGDFASGPGNYDSSLWEADGFLNDGTSGAARVNLYTNTRNEWLVSPSFDLSADGYELVFDIGITKFSGSDNSSMGSDDQVHVLYTVDGLTWTSLQSWEAGNEPSNLGETVVIDLAGTTGSDVKFAFYATDGSVIDTEDYNIYIDNFKVRTPPTCPEVLGVIASNINGNSLDLEWNALSAEANGYEWFVMAEGEDPSVDSPVQTGTTATGVTTASVSGLTETTVYDIYVRADCDTNGIGNFSNVLTIETTVSCAAPTNVVFDASTVTTSTAEFTWAVSASEELGYNWVVMAEGEDPAVDTPVESGTTNPGDTSLTVSGLTSATAYDFYILSNCDTNGLSDYADSVSFLTACEIFIPDYTQDFSDFVPVCWDEAKGGDFVTGPATFGSSSWFSDGFINDGSTGAARVNLYTNTREEWLISPAFDLSADGYELVFDIGITKYYTQDPTAMGSDDEFFVLYSTDGVTWTSLQSWANGSEPSNTGETVTIDLTGTTGSNVRFAFYATDGSTDDTEDYNIYIDNFNVRSPLTCPEVAGLAISNIFSTEAELSWTDNAEAVNGYEWFVMAEGEDPAVDTPLATGTTAAGVSIATVTGLTADTNYEAYVMADCDVDGMSPLSNPVSFSTLIESVIVTPGTTESETYCYESNDFKEWLFESSDGSSLTIEFIQGTLEGFGGNTYDDLMIYDGGDDTGIVLYDSDNATTPGNLASLILTAESGLMYMTLDSDSSNSCADGSVTEIIFNVDAGTASNSDFFSDANFSYYPNPVESRFVINSTYALEQIVIYNMLGQEVRDISPQSTEVSFDLSDVQAGVYLVKATVEGQTQTFRLIKE